MLIMTRTMLTGRRAAAGALGIALALALIAATVLPSLAQTAPLPIGVELLTARAQFTDTVDAQFRVKLDGGATNVLNMPDASRTLTARFTVQPGAQFPWHTHPGPVMVNVVQGTLVYVQAIDCIERAYPAGTAFIDPGRGNVHTAFNPDAATPTVFIATIFDLPADGALSDTNVVPGDCDIQVGTHAGH